MTTKNNTEQVAETVMLSKIVEDEEPIMFDHEQAFAEAEMRTVLKMNHETLTKLNSLATVRSQQERNRKFVDVIRSRNDEVNS